MEFATLSAAFVGGVTGSAGTSTSIFVELVCSCAEDSTSGWPDRDGGAGFSSEAIGCVLAGFGTDGTEVALAVDFEDAFSPDLGGKEVFLG